MFSWAECCVAHTSLSFNLILLFLYFNLCSHFFIIIFFFGGVGGLLTRMVDCGVPKTIIGNKTLRVPDDLSHTYGSWCLYQAGVREDGMLTACSAVFMEGNRHGHHLVAEDEGRQ